MERITYPEEIWIRQIIFFLFIIHISRARTHTRAHTHTHTHTHTQVDNIMIKRDKINIEILDDTRENKNLNKDKFFRVK